MNSEVTVSESQNFYVFSGGSAFDNAQRMAKALAASDIVPQNFKGNMPNCLIALEMALRIKASPLQVMQNLYMVHGRPSWSSQFVIAAINTCGRYSPLRFKIEGEGDERTCIAYAVEKETGEILESPPVSIGMAKKEGWYGKNGSKWQTLPELMLRYRAATFFGRLYAPEILMGMKAVEEAEDMEPIDVTPPSNADKLNDKYLQPEVVVEEKQPEAFTPVTEPAVQVQEATTPQVESPTSKIIAIPKKKDGTPNYNGFVLLFKQELKKHKTIIALQDFWKANDPALQELQAANNGLYDSLTEALLEQDKLLNMKEADNAKQALSTKNNDTKSEGGE